MNLFHYVLDPKLLHNLPRYVLQCSLATLVLLGVLLRATRWPAPSS